MFSSSLRAPTGRDPHADRWRVLGVLCLSLAIVMIGNSSLNLALPELARDLDAPMSSLQWMVDAYALAFAALLFPAGTLGDRFGRKRALQAGLVVFLVAAVMGATASSAGGVIAARGVMGVAAAFVMPSTLSILTNVFPPQERARAIGLWAGISAGAGAAGPIVTGLLLDRAWWGSVFLVNVPLVVAALVFGRRVVPESRDPDSTPIDVPGVALSAVAIGALVYAIIQAPEHGWASGATIAAFTVAATGVVAFTLRELRARHPMLDLTLFRDRRFSVSSAGIALAFFAMFGTWFVVTQYLQLVLGHTPLEAALLMAPFALVMMVLAPQAPRLVARAGNGPVAAGGLGLIAVGLAAFSTLEVDGSSLALWTSMLPLAAGMALTGSPLTALIMSAVSTSRAGMGSAMNDTTRELGGALGVAVLGSLVTTRFGALVEPSLGGLADGAREVAGTGLAGALQVAGELPGPAGPALAAAARSAFVDGMHLAAVVAAAVVAVAAGAAYVMLPRRPLAASSAPAGASPAPDVDAA